MVHINSQNSSKELEIYMSRKRKDDSLWLATARVKGIRFVAIAAKKPQSPSFRLTRMQFRSISLNDLDDLYKLGKQQCIPEAQLTTEPPDFQITRLPSS
jgi:hypothetical protein